MGAATLSDLPGLEKLEDYRPPTATRILDRDGREIDEIFVERREPVPADEIPENLKHALVATEDARFYRHHGVDFLGLVRAVGKHLLLRKRLAATSTLTQQLAKNLFLSPERSLARKLKEAALAFQIERKYTKSQILTLYLNQIYLGSGAFGVQAAAHKYFGKDVKDLDLGQCALLAGLPKSPSGYDPFKFPDKARERRAVVLGRMRDAGFLTDEQVDRWKNTPLGVVVANAHEKEGGLAPYFVAALKPELETRFGEQALYSQGLQVWTTLDLDAQAAAQKALQDGVGEVAKREEAWGKRARKKPEDLEAPQGALVALQPASGDVVALVGGTDWTRTQFNRALTAHRQPGSSFKPIVYAAALETGWTQSSALWDAPTTYTDRNGKTWAPKNFYPGYLGRITLRTALEQSSNCASVYLLERIGVQSAVDMARRLGIVSPLAPNLTLTLGASDVTLAEMTRAYAAFANGGVRTDSRLLLRVLDRNGRLLYQAPPSEGRAVLTPENAWLVGDLLHGVTTKGLSHAVSERLPFWVAGKTGTTSKSTDALFVGFSSNLAVGVWVGLDSHDPMVWGESGSHAAQPIFTDFLAATAARFQPAADIPPPPGVVKASVDMATGLLASDSCDGPGKGDTEEVYFMPGTEPARPCTETTVSVSDLPFALKLPGDVGFE